MPRLAVPEWATLVAIAALWVAFHHVPDNHARTRLELEARASNWQANSRATVSNPALLVDDIRLAGTWVCKQRLTSSSFEFTPTNRRGFVAQFSTHGCLGGCELRRGATFSGGTIRLDDAVAEYRPRTYDTLYAVQIDGVEYLLPEHSVPMFERELTSSDGAWKFYVFRRYLRGSEPDNAR